jgi:putative hydrolase of the HAD superfamily
MVNEERLKSQKKPFKSVKFVYFDIGGTLFDFQPSLMGVAKALDRPFAEIKTIFEEFDMPVCRGEMQPQELWQKFKDGTRFKTKITEENFMDFWVDNFVPFQEMNDLMIKLSKRYPIGLLTNVYPGAYDLMIKKGKIPNIPYTSVIQSCEIGIVKPLPAVFELAEQKIKVKPEEIFFIDDSEKNIKYAKTRNWKTHQFNPCDSRKSKQTILASLLD